MGSSISDTGLCCGASSVRSLAYRLVYSRLFPALSSLAGRAWPIITPHCLRACAYIKRHVLARLNTPQQAPRAARPRTGSEPVTFPEAAFGHWKRLFPPLTLSCRQFLLDSFLDSFSLWSDFSFHFDFGTLLREKTSACSQLTLTFVDYPETVFL